jgi:hypothetical protein
MDRQLCCHCLNAFQNALKTPMGEAFSHVFRSLRPQPDDSMDLFRVYSDLSENLYSCPAEWIADVTAATTAAVRHFGPDSDLSLAILTVSQLISDFAQPLLPTSEDSWSAALVKFSDSLASVAAGLSQEPDASRPDSSPRRHRPPAPSPTPEQSVFDAVNLIELKSMVLRLPSDEDIQYVGRLIARHQPQYSTLRGAVEFDLKNCQPYTLQLVYDYVRSKGISPTQRAQPPDLPRLGSAPLPTVFSPEDPRPKDHRVAARTSTEEISQEENPNE